VPVWLVPPLGVASPLPLLTVPGEFEPVRINSQSGLVPLTCILASVTTRSGQNRAIW
jgi:hypothetical protein